MSQNARHYKHLGEVVRTARTARAISRNALGALLEVTGAFVYLVEEGKRSIAEAKRPAWAKELGVEVSELDLAIARDDLAAANEAQNDAQARIDALQPV